MDTAESVSKGCFAYKKGKKKVANPAAYFTKKDIGCEARLEAYQSLWEIVDTDIKIMQSDLNSQIFEELLAFAASSHSPRSSDEEEGRHLCKAIQEIPTAALITGVNTPDHAVMFSNLVQLLKERVSSLVATLRSKDCPNLKTTLSKMISQLTSNPDLMLDDDDDDVAPKRKQAACTVSTLCQWYNSKFRSASSSPKKRRSGGGAVETTMSQPPLVVVLEDMESFLPHVLQDVISICSNYIHELPLVLVFGIATSVTAVHRLLPNSVSSLLCMEKFQAPPSSEYLTQVINKVLMTATFPFKLGPKVFQLLLDIFLYHDFSVLNFIKGLQFCMLEHFYNQPLSHLCCHLVDIDSTVSSLSHKELDRLRQVPSFSRYMEENCSSEDQSKLREDNKLLKERVKDLLIGLHDYHSTFFPILQCLNVWGSVLPRYPLGKQLRELYATSLESDVCDSEAYKEAMTLFRMLSKDELSSLVTSCVERTMSLDLPPGLEQLPDQLHELLIVLEKEEEEVPETEPAEKDEVRFTKTDLHTLRKTLKEMGKKRRFSPFEQQRETVIDFFDSLFRKYLKCPSSQPLHELVYYSSVSGVRRHINASPRLAIQKALSNRAKYLQCECCEGEHGAITSSMPDLCIVYKLHLECPQLINLYDWLQAFITVVTEDEQKRTKDEDSLLQARFIRSVSELQFLGFIKPTKRKTDHVARLTWGGC
ncbi:origin recognition complex subunit 3-like [Haliotis rubra]|uniref:origin recognition complex subunit 3-like n=1 Tax=Haliotis rubra TaxID=36100 RepID=UPI001EE56535|nr:origin recognition complex subunit 3-like [Haliotis rubra]